jgi:3-isopropylmalate/(R)-2-methylmalate dehydratase small subunit
LKVSGKVVKYGDDINTDLILPGKYLTLTDPKEMAKHAMEGLDPSFTKRCGETIVVAGKNFGCGSSREQAPLSLKYAGTKCVIAKSFARIFYRNAVNIGLPVLECEELWSKVEENDTLEVDLETGTVRVLNKNIVVKAQPLPKFIIEILSEGGLLNMLKKQMKK